MIPSKKLKEFLFIIPARSGSKELKNKNIKKINGKFLIEYTFDLLKENNIKNKYVITDSDFIKKIANKYNINSDYIRPKNLSGSKIELLKNIIHFNKHIEDKLIFKYYVILQPTSPLRSIKDLENAINQFINKKYESLFSISKSIEHPNETIYLKKNIIHNFLKKTKSLRQLYKKSYFINGAIYIFDKKLLLKNTIISKNKHGYSLMKKINSIDIDDLEDLELVKNLL